MKETPVKIKEIIEDIKIGIRYYRLARRYARRNIDGITTKSLKSVSYEKA